MKWISRILSVAALAGFSAVPILGWAQGQAPAATTTPSSITLAKGLSKSFADVYEKVSPGVVVIEVERGPDPDESNQASALQFFFQNQGMADQMPPDFRSELNQGSGFIITKDGYILTNNHVLAESGPSEIKVTLHDGRTFSAQMVGMDPASDLAVLKIEAPDLQPIELADSDKVRVGEFAFALGAPYDLRYSFTFGIIGAVGRG
jgi:serine protease Do